MEVAERCEVILAHQDVRVPQVRQVLRLGVQFVLEALRRNHKSGDRQDVLYVILIKQGVSNRADGGPVQNKTMSFFLLLIFHVINCAWKAELLHIQQIELQE